jgi:hypothetical protein
VYYLVVELTGPGGATSVGNSISTIAVQSPVITLTGAVTRLPVMAKIGRKIAATIAITNSGNVTAVGPLQMMFHASPDATLANGVIVLRPFTRPIRIRPGKSERIHVGRIVLSSTAGSYYLVGQLDPNAAFPDINAASSVFVSDVVALG